VTDWLWGWDDLRGGMDVNMGVGPESPPTQESDSDYNAGLICCMFM
jgi:hypothetical protein